MTTRTIFVAGACLASLLMYAAPAQSQNSRCADCHFSQPDAPGRAHLSDWDRSAHGHSNVGCEKCHGGDATTFESMQAHRGVLGSANPASPVNRQNLPVTCGVCHAGPFAAFQDSRHFALLRQGDTRVPTCSTCHGAAGFLRPSARALEGECQRCHGPSGVAPQVERAEAARTLYDALHESRDLLKVAKPLISRIKDGGRRAELDAEYQQAEVPLIQATQAGHRFVYDELKERLLVARQRIEALFGRLANP